MGQEQESVTEWTLAPKGRGEGREEGRRRGGGGGG